MSADLPKPPKSPLLAYLASDDHERRGWRLFVYLVLSYAVAWVVHIPVHHGVENAIIPAALPWAIAAGVAIWQHRKRLSLLPAWLTLGAASAFFITPHLLLG